tara:strand:+ start:432 stop:1001 length:570 start_codon:yes stop_codon:yes gene_type:complete
MTYNKINYWNNRKDPNNDFCRSQTYNHVNLVKPFITKNLNILEYGPGIGRMIELYKDQTHINFFDISSAYEERLKQKCDSQGLKIQQYIIDKDNTIKTPFKDNEFDIVCAFEVLIHSPETEIDELIRELSRIGKKVIVITWYKNGETLSSSYCFTRDYKNIIKKNNLKLIHWDEDSLSSIPQVFYVYSK